MKKIDLFTINKWFLNHIRTKPQVKHYHVALFWWITEKANQSYWADSFYFPTEEAMISSGFSNWRTYSKTLLDLEKFKIIEIIEKSKNQFTPCIISPTFYKYVEEKQTLNRLETTIEKTQSKPEAKADQLQNSISVETLQLINTYILDNNNIQFIPQYLIEYFKLKNFDFIMDLSNKDLEIKKMILNAIEIIINQKAN